MSTPAQQYRAKGQKRPDERRIQLAKRAFKGLGSVLAIVATIGSLTTYGLTWQAILIAVFASIFFASVLGNAWFLFADSQTARQGPKKIAFLMPSSGGQPFYSALLLALVRNAVRTLGQNYVLLPSMPNESFETVSIWSLFASLEDRQIEIDGIIFIPDDPDQHFDELVGFHEERGDIPLVLIDVYFDPQRYDDRTRARLPSFVGGDELVGGQLAADMIIRSIEDGLDSDPVVLIINGGVAKWEMQRASSCREALRSKWPHVVFVETPPINYIRSGAYAATIYAIKQLAQRATPVKLDAVFACNDDMAIGARGAISQLAHEGIIFQRKPRIIGYDGIPEIREYIEEGDPYIVGTVDVRIEEQARQTMLLVQQLIRSGMRRTEVRLIKPEALRARSR
jgi:ABC-type sugar transport system substrate-binding protein